MAAVRHRGRRCRSLPAFVRRFEVHGGGFPAIDRNSKPNPPPLRPRRPAAASFASLALSALAITVCLLPWCIGMGATFPLVMAYMREIGARDEKSFSYLYLANVIGASAGALLAAGVLVEVLGFRQTLWIA